MKLLVVEDDVPIAESLTRGLIRIGYIVEQVHDGRSAIAATSASVFDLIILDLGLPDIDGTEVLRTLRRQHEVHTPILILTARDDISDRVKGLNLGADDYMIKPFELTELEARVRAVTRRATGASTDEMRIGTLSLAVDKRQVSIGGAPLDLSPREYGVLESLVRRQGCVVSKRQLLEQLCSWDDDLSEGAIEIYVYRIRQKLKGSGISIRTVRGFGYLLEKSSGD